MTTLEKMEKLLAEMDARDQVWKAWDTIAALTDTYRVLVTEQNARMEEYYKQEQAQLQQLEDQRNKALAQAEGQEEKKAEIRERYLNLCQEQISKWKAFDEKVEQVHKAQRKEGLEKILAFLDMEQLSFLDADDKKEMEEHLVTYRKLYDEEFAR